MKQTGPYLNRLVEFAKELDSVEESEFDLQDVGQLAFELNEFLIPFFDPADVGDVRKMPAHLHMHALDYLVERDAADEYDDITGYLDEIPEHCEKILESCLATDKGVDICRWIDQHIPVSIIS